MTEPAIIERTRQVVDQSIEIIERRINQLGLVEPSIQRQGADRILVQVPGLGDPQQLIDLIGKTAKLTFRLVDMSMTAEQALADPPAAGIGNRLRLQGRRRAALSARKARHRHRRGTHRRAAGLRSAHQRADRQFPLQFLRRAQVRAGRRSENIGRPFAIVLDNEVISAPVIREPITQGSGQISGNFTVESANNLAILLRAGALPAKLTVIEQRVVGAGLGQDSIEKGRHASYFGAALVVVFMVVTYGLFGVFASVAVAHQRRR